MATPFETYKPGKESLTPDLINQKLSYFYVQTHDNHLNTTSHEEHMALNPLYDGLVDFKDKIGELLLAYVAPKRFNSEYSIKIVKKTSEQLVQEGIDFSHQLYDWAEEYDWIELCNFAADLEGLFQKTKYMLTLR